MNSAGLSISSAVGRKSGWFQTASRRSTPTAFSTRRHSSAASETFGAPSSMPTTWENACSADPPVARRASRLRSWRRWMGCVRSGLG